DPVAVIETELVDGCRIQNVNFVQIHVRLYGIAGSRRVGHVAFRIRSQGGANIGIAHEAAGHAVGVAEDVIDLRQIEAAVGNVDAVGAEVVVASDAVRRSIG